MTVTDGTTFDTVAVPSASFLQLKWYMPKIAAGKIRKRPQPVRCHEEDAQ